MSGFVSVKKNLPPLAFPKFNFSLDCRVKIKGRKTLLTCYYHYKFCGWYQMKIVEEKFKEIKNVTHWKVAKNKPNKEVQSLNII